MIYQKCFFIFICVITLSGRVLELPDQYLKINSKSDAEKKNYQPYFENRIHKAGLLWLNVANCGFIGHNYQVIEMQDPCTGVFAASAELPGGSGKDYLYAANLSFGGYLDSADIEINGSISKIFQGPLVSTGFENMYALELQPYYFRDDPSGLTMGRINETSNIEGRMNCLFQEVYDPKATAYEQFNVGFTDKGINSYTENTFDDIIRGHIPLGIEVKQVSYSWPYEYAKKFIIMDYTIYNRNDEQKDIYDFFIGFHVDSDIRNVNVNLGGALDDICGFIEKWDGYIDPASGESKSVDLNLIWTADNDGREYSNDSEDPNIIYEPGADNPLNGATGVFSIRVLRNPSSDLKYSFNLWNTSWEESGDWGPHWKTGLHADWQYDLSPKQQGYDDTNQDNLYWYEENFGHDYPMFNGRTEGTPFGDKGRYMVMSNDEFDYNLTSIREVYLGMTAQADGTPIPQSDKWQPWIETGTEGEGEISDGGIGTLNDIANGVDQRYNLSFGPLGIESYVNVAVDNDRDGNIDGYKNKKVWKFAYGDSLKLTLAIIVNENFHTSLKQDPNYYDPPDTPPTVDLNKGIDVSLFDQGWYDALYNVLWAERLFDVPMYDTPVKKFGESKKDGWYGEDVGADAMFGDILGGNLYCWWLETGYSGADEGEDDFELTSFTTPITDCYGNIASSEDELLPYGRQIGDTSYGITGSQYDGEGYGYMVKYDKMNESVPQGAWVRYGYDNGKLDPGDGVPDFICPPPPHPPKLNISYSENDIIIEWSSHEFYTSDNDSVNVTGSELTYDSFTRLYDFEGYEIEISPDRKGENYSTVFSVDKVNYSYQNVVDVEDYIDNPIPADTVYAHQEDFPFMKTYNNKIYRLVPYGDNRDLTQNYSKEGLYSYTCTIAQSPYPGWGDVRYYRFVFHNQTIGQQKFIAVTAKDFGAAKMGVPGTKSSPESNGVCTVTSKITSTDEVVVVPNPYRDDTDYTNMGWENLNGQYGFNEEYRKIAFLNIPERCIIRIYTLAGDLVKVIPHNGNAKWNTPYLYGINGAYWNLISDNQQAVVSGIYLFSVQDVDKKKDDFIGKFVIIK